MLFSVQVETVADTYMVSCGVPIENPYHASELAMMALSLRNSIASYKVSVSSSLNTYIKLIRRLLHALIWSLGH